jgi:transcriptional regulator with XRE-family HTH domain
LTSLSPSYNFISGARLSSRIIFRGAIRIFIMGEERDPIRELKLGEKIKNLRSSMHLSLKEVAEKTGLTEPVLSQIENDIVPPTIAALAKISRSLKVELGYFFQKDLFGGEVEVVRRDERKIVRRQRRLGSTPLSYSYQSLAYRKTQRNMQPFLIEFDIDIQEELPSLSHEGEEFLYLLEGELEFRTDKETVILHEGDSLYFDSQISHALYGRGKKKPKAIVVIFTPRD